MLLENSDKEGNGTILELCKTKLGWSPTNKNLKKHIK